MVRHIRNKDLLFRRIADVREVEDFILVTMKDSGVRAYLVEPFVPDMGILSPLNNHDCCFLVCYNTPENLDFLIVNWDALVKFKRNFCMIFVNPFSTTDKKWAVYPATHDIITERPALKSGLQVLFSTVDKTTKEEIERIVKKEQD